MKEYPVNRKFHEAFYDDSVICPAERSLMILEVHILEALGGAGKDVRPVLHGMSLAEVNELLNSSGYRLVVAKRS